MSGRTGHWTRWLAGMVLWVVAGPALAEPVDVRAWPHDGYVRLVFDWQQPVSYEARIEGNDLVVSFDRQIESDFRQVRDNLEASIQDVAVSDDGTVVRFALTGAHSVRHFVLDGAVVVDASPVAGAAVSPAAGGDGATDDAPGVPVRAGVHADFSRLVFDWPARTDYTISGRDDGVRVSFGRDGAFALDRVQRSLPTGLLAISADGRSVDLTLAPGIGVQDFRNGTSVVVDLRAGAPRPPVVADNDAVAPTDEPVVPDVAASLADVAADAVAAADAAPDPAPVADNAEVADSAPVALTPPAAETPAADAAVAGDVAENGVEDSTVVEAVAALEALAAREPQVLLDEQVAVKPPVTLVPGAAVSLADLPALGASFTPTATGGTMTFAVSDPGAAVFRRGGALWVVLAQAGRIDISGLTSAAGDVVVRAEQLPVAEATVLRLETIAGFNPVVSFGEGGLALAFGPQVLAPTKRLDIVAADTDAGTAVRVEVAGALAPIVLADPALGDVITVVPVTAAGAGVADDREFVAVQLSETAQGIAVATYGDGLEVIATDDAVLVAGAVAVTPGDERQRIQDAAAGENVLPRMFDFVAWRRDAEVDFTEARHALLARVARTDAEDINVARLDLARFLFAHGQASEAVGVLSAIAREGDQATRDPDFRALRGASLFLLGRHDGAAPDLGDRGLDDEPEIGVWRAALAADQGAWDEAALGLRESELYVQRYPDRLRVRFSLLGAEAMLNAEDPVGAESFLESLEGVDLQAAERARFELLRGRLAAFDGDTEAALAAYDLAIAGEDRRARALATLARVDLALELEEITVGEAIEELDQLRFVWRGDDIELDVLSRLGDLHIEDGAYRAGLQTLKRAATNFSEHPRVAELTTRMQGTFESLFVSGGAKDLPALQAIALFNQFRELTPAGPEGDEMIRTLAERLVSVDLLDQAAALLTHQVDFRVDGEAKAEVGARLAVVRLLDRRPEAALEALDISLVDAVSDGVALERRLLEARARAELGEVDAALAVIAEDGSFEADQLRAEILWRAREWQRAAPVFTRLIGGAPAAQETLDQQRSRFVLNLAVALSLGGDRAALARLREDFGPAMQRTDFAYDFRVIAADDSDPADFNSALARVAAVDDFQAFLDNYRARLGRAPDEAG